MSILKRGDIEVIRKVRASNGGGIQSSLFPKATVKRLILCGAIRFKPCAASGDLSTPDHVWASRAAQAGMVIHGPNADALLAQAG